MYNQLRDYLDTFVKLDEEAADEIESNFVLKKFPKNSFLAMEGEVATEVHFLIKGCCRFFHKKNNRAVTHWFSFENTFTTALRSFTTQTPCNEYILTLEECTVLSLRHQNLMRMYDKHKQWERLGRLVMEDFSRLMLERVTNLQTLTAKQRYITLLEKEPRIIQRIPLNLVSSYLGISGETLSRVRSEIRI
ncbi:MAG: Crp/Fnr family transcriptional regulator [Cyclobacteriaceae bacterium]